MSMNKKVMAAAIGGLFAAGVSQAGTISSPATDAAATKYAAEALTASTDITLPAIGYTMGVARTPAQDFTIILTPSAGSSFTVGSCLAAVPVVSGAGAGTATVKRASTTECAYEVDVTTDFTTSSVLTFTGLVLDSHTLNTAGSNASVVVNLWDLGETARIDNSGPLSRVVAASGNALTITATADTGTVANVDDPLGPLYGFLVANDDTADTATATFQIGNNTGGYVLPDGTTPWNCKTECTSIKMTITGNFSGLAANGFTVDAPLTDPAVTVSGSTATFTIVPANINAALGQKDFHVSFKANGTESLGTSRAFGVSGVGDVLTGSDVTLAGNANWWQWSANASQLMTPYFTTWPQYQTRYFFLNTSNSAVTYSAQCFAESGNAITYGPAKNGTLSAKGQTYIDARSVCTFAGNTRGAVIFTINAPIEVVKGTYQYTDPVTLNSTMAPLVRPYGQQKTTE